MRKSIVYSAFLSSALVASGAFANDGAMQPAPAKNPCHMGGFYIGAAVGYGSHKARTDQNLTSVALATTTLHKNDLSLDGANGGLFLGYGKEFGGSRVYLGLEFGYFLDGSKGKYEYVPGALAAPGDLLKTEAKRKDGMELAARMGLIFNQTMPYIKLGWANTRVEATQVVASDALATTLLTQKFLNKRLNGLLVGAGIDMKLNRNLIAGLEYTFATYQKKGTQQAVATGVGPTAINNWDSKLKLTDNKFRLRLAYQF